MNTLRRAVYARIGLGVAATAGSASCAASDTLANTDEHEELARQWTAEESHPDYLPPSASWPRKQPRLSRVPSYRAALGACGGLDVPACHQVAFTLAAALLGGALFGHTEHADECEPTEANEQEGLELLYALAARGSAEGACGLGFCLLDGPGGLERDERRASLLFEQAAHAGLPVRRVGLIRARVGRAPEKARQLEPCYLLLKQIMAC
jgi:hypothetical protein